MNARFSEIRNLNLIAADGPIGEVIDLLIDDAHWIARYLVVAIEDENSATTKQVLISPEAILEADFENRCVTTQLDSKHVKSSPSLDDKQPISRQHELALAEHYGWSIYWVGQAMLSPQTLDRLSGGDDLVVESEDEPNLRSADEVCGYQIRSRSGRAGVMSDLVINLKSWRVRNGVADSSTWLPTESSMFSTNHIEAVDWAKREISVDLTREALLPFANKFLESLTPTYSFVQQPTPMK